MRWHFLVSAPASGPDNMALDEALMGFARRSGDAVFRVYGWSSRILSLGRNQRARGVYDLEAARQRDITFVRRPTGGRALLHHREITYSVVMPCAGPGPAAAAYNLINEVLLGALSALGVPARLADAEPAIAPGPRPCFDLPAAHEIAVNGRKLVGSAQWRHGETLLQHGSILLHDDQSLIAQVMLEPLAAPPGAATIVQALGREPTIVEVVGQLRASLGAATSQPIGSMNPDASLRADTLARRAVYADAAWTWRR